MTRMGYLRDGIGSSHRALAAEDDGKLPITRAIPVVADRLAITRRAARELLEAEGPCEWHHTSRYGNQTDFYDTRAVIAASRGDVEVEEIEDVVPCRLYAPPSEPKGLHDPLLLQARELMEGREPSASALRKPLNIGVRRAINLRDALLHERRHRP